MKRTRALPDSMDRFPDLHARAGQGTLAETSRSLALRSTEPPMSHDSHVARRQVEITNALGLHLRPAEKFVRLADCFQSEIRVVHKGQSIDGKSIMGVIGLAAERGTRLELEACGPDADDALTALIELISADFHEDENGFPIEPANGPVGPEVSP